MPHLFACLHLIILTFFNGISSLKTGSKSFESESPEFSKNWYYLNNKFIFIILGILWDCINKIWGLWCFFGLRVFIFLNAVFSATISSCPIMQLTKWLYPDLVSFSVLSLISLVLLLFFFQLSNTILWQFFDLINFCHLTNLLPQEKVVFTPRSLCICFASAFVSAFAPFVLHIFRRLIISTSFTWSFWYLCRVTSYCRFTTL